MQVKTHIELQTRHSTISIKITSLICSPYWLIYVTACEIWVYPITGPIRVTLFIIFTVQYRRQWNHYYQSINWQTNQSINQLANQSIMWPVIMFLQISQNERCDFHQIGHSKVLQIYRDKYITFQLMTRQK